jgi:hypothetical protein
VFRRIERNLDVYLWVLKGGGRISGSQTTALVFLKVP